MAWMLGLLPKLVSALPSDLRSPTTGEHRVERSPAAFLLHERGWQRCPTSELRAWRDDYLRDGLVIARGFMDEATLGAIQQDLEDLVDGYAQKLLTREQQNKLRRQGLGFDHKYTAIYQANLHSRANQGLRSDLPSYFRSEAHTNGVHKFLTHTRLHELIRCVMPRTESHGADFQQALKLYPVYMARGKVPDSISKSAMTVDWHQDAAYTYYWYSALNTTIQQIEEYARSVVNTWVPITDTPLELGPVQLIRRRPPSLTRADMRCEGDGCVDATAEGVNDKMRSTSGGQREYLRISGIDSYIRAFPERVLTAEVRRGDVILFDQFTYHRGLPNVSPNMTRWSVDFRFQDARVPTLRSHPGYILGSEKTAVAAAEISGAPLIATDEDWQAARPAQRLSEAQKHNQDHSHSTVSVSQAIGGHRWAEQHHEKDTLLGALQLERRRHVRAAESDHCERRCWQCDGA